MKMVMRDQNRSEEISPGLSTQRLPGKEMLRRSFLKFSEIPVHSGTVFPPLKQMHGHEEAGYQQPRHKNIFP